MLMLASLSSSNFFSWLSSITSLPLVGVNYSFYEIPGSSFFSGSTYGNTIKIPMIDIASQQNERTLIIFGTLSATSLGKNPFLELVPGKMNMGILELS